MSREVRITTGSRLHWGLLSLAPATGREFGGIGLMVDAPQFVLSVKQTPAEQDRITCSDTYYSKVEGALNAARLHLSDSSEPCFFSVELQSEIPMHCGFGSGTQLSLAVARAISVLSEEQELASVKLASRVGRGARSALGVHGFDCGGFLVEGGKQKPGQISPLVSRADFPEDWKILLITPRDQAGISGTVEAEAIQRLGPMPVSITEYLCRLVLMQLLPAVLTHDFAEFSSGLSRFGHTVGEFFKPAQGGIYAHPQMAELEILLMAHGIQGIAQTSWGPTLSVVCPSSAETENVTSVIVENGYGELCSLRTVNPLNQGAQIQINESV
ncbi:beta-ribofuranosylaminobenzene 5'-phosphate synthase family protein [uncultured Gimesia sp.]|uniref:beta-ribofuranosylaminobenzene 5'-phosphate synthase family protein n=1 Tax=uncultured Gimesia sp. TaxID=1678688 RepID=UPI0030D6DC3D|tara:strand:- start:117582 stop:118565 length:984 start_codon:yes stop_codon:yes gene_type:complete